MSAFLLKNGTLINEGRTYAADIRLRNGRIDQIAPDLSAQGREKVIDAEGQYVLPGLIDDQVHFREPGLTHKGDLASESRAAVAGGITSFMEMPNTQPPTLTQALLQQKYDRAAQVSRANYSFYMGVSNDNLAEVLRTDPRRVCGIKVFMGSSTGNLLVDDEQTLRELFRDAPTLIATHCEDEATIRQNTAQFRAQYGEDAPAHIHPLVRSAEACYLSSSRAVALAHELGTRLHVLHISTARELALFAADRPLADKRITAEACIHHLWFADGDYATHGTHIKWNPAVKTAADRAAIRQAVRDNVIDVIATDHAPHTREEKAQPYFAAPSGGPLVQHGLAAMWELVHQGELTAEKVVEKMAHAPATLYRVHERGFLREGYWADVVVLHPNQPQVVTADGLHYKCGWSPFEGQTFGARVTHTFVSGHLAYAKGQFDESQPGQRLSFDR